MAWSPPELRTLKRAAKSAGALALLTTMLPANLTLTGVALARLALLGDRPQPGNGRRRTILISGGKMTKALELARAFHTAGHRVVLVEQEKYRFTGHRFSRAVDAFHTVPKPQSPDYAAALLRIVLVEGVDVYVPVCSPAASVYDALAEPLLAPYCEVLHADAEMIRTLDDKDAFARLAASLGLPVPDEHRVESPDDVIGFPFGPGDEYVLKSIAYDPVNRLDLTPVPRPTVAETVAFARSKPISPDNPWIMQRLVRGTEYCTHSTVRGGRVQVYCCCESSAFQVNYEMTDVPEIESWVRGFVEPLKLTGQFSFDFIRTADGQVWPIECNPRTHSAITMFHGHPGLAQAYLEDDGPVIDRPEPASRPTYWLYHELWRMVSQPSTALARLSVVRRGRDAIFDWSDPVPFLLVHHLQIPSLLLGNLVRNRPWIRIDFNIGKLVEPAGD